MFSTTMNQIPSVYRQRSCLLNLPILLSSVVSITLIFLEIIKTRHSIPADDLMCYTEKTLFHVSCTWLFSAFVNSTFFFFSIVVWHCWLLLSFSSGISLRCQSAEKLPTKSLPACAYWKIVPTQAYCASAWKNGLELVFQVHNEFVIIGNSFYPRWP